MTGLSFEGHWLNLSLKLVEVIASTTLKYELQTDGVTAKFEPQQNYADLGLEQQRHKSDEKV